MPFAAILTANTALPLSSLAVTGYAFHYLGNIHSLYISTARAMLHLLSNVQEVKFVLY